VKTFLKIRTIFNKAGGTKNQTRSKFQIEPGFFEFRKCGLKELPEKTSAERKKSNPPPRNKMEQATDEAWSRGKKNPGECFRSIFFWKSWVEFWFGTA
jgi:hypothetical protein